MRSSILLTSLVALTASTDAAAWDAVLGVTFRISSEVTLEASTDASTSTTRNEEGRPARARRTRFGPKQEWTSEGALEGSQCQEDGDCQGWCRAGRCVDTMSPASPQAPQPIPPPPAPPLDFRQQECREALACGPGQQCIQGQCATPPPLPAPAGACQDSSQCAGGERCLDGQCVPSSSSLDQRLELQLRGRATELREELALGGGPLISLIAAHSRMEPRALGGLVRAHRQELVALMNESRGWPGPWLRRVQGLAAEANRGGSTATASR